MARPSSFDLTPPRHRTLSTCLLRRGWPRDDSNHRAGYPSEAAHKQDWAGSNRSRDGNYSSAWTKAHMHTTTRPPTTRTTATTASSSSFILSYRPTLSGRALWIILGPLASNVQQKQEQQPAHHQNHHHSLHGDRALIHPPLFPCPSLQSTQPGRTNAAPGLLLHLLPPAPPGGRGRVVGVGSAGHFSTGKDVRVGGFVCEKK